MDLVPVALDVLSAEDEFDCDEDVPQALVTELRTIRMANAQRKPTRRRLLSGLPRPIVAPISNQSVGAVGAGGIIRPR
jgi:hypothetical protein